MNHHARRLARDLEALGFNRAPDRDTRTGQAWVHPNQPDETLKVTDRMTDNAITAVSRKANRIADTGWAGPRQPQSVRDRATMRRRAETQYEQKVRAERAARAAAAEAKWQAAQAAKARATRDREIRSLMQPGYGR